MHCERCKERIEHSEIIVTICDLGKVNPNSIAVSFCGWECAAMWFDTKAGEVLTREAGTSRTLIGEIEIIEND